MTLTRRLLWPLAILLLVSSRLPAAELFYLGQKIPDIQRPWSSGDYRLLIEALDKIDKTQVNALPRRSGEFTGPIYQRMTSPDNFKPQLNIYAPLELRQNEAREVLFQLKELMRLYFDFKHDDVVRTAEFTVAVPEGTGHQDGHQDGHSH